MSDGVPRVIRPAAPVDIPAIRTLLTAHGNDGPIVSGDVVGPYVRQLVDHHRVLVSDEGGAIVGFGSVAFTGVSTHLADLFVAPDLLGLGIGRPLLEALFGDAPIRTTFASDDPRAMPLYIRAGMRPSWPMLYLGGDPAGLPAPPAGLTTETTLPDALAALELAWRGVHRSADHAHWGSTVDADAFAVVEAGEPIAFAYARARQGAAVRSVDRLLIRPDAEVVPALLAAFHRAARGGALSLAIPGPSPVLPILLASGFRIDDRDTFMASEPGLFDPERLLPNSGLL